MNDLQISQLQQRLNYFFRDPKLLISSLTHSSYANENIKSGVSSNERFEFLGDSLLGMAVAMLLYNSKPELTEGQMTKLRAEIVCEKNLASLATELELGSCLKLGRGEERGGGRHRPSILADAFEAVLAAVYLDGGFKPVEKLTITFFGKHIDSPVKSYTDHKTVLQEMIQVKPGQTLVYEIIDQQGPDHSKIFTVEAKLNGKTIGTGTGKSKKSAEQASAKAAINKLSNK